MAIEIVAKVARIENRLWRDNGAILPAQLYVDNESEEAVFG